MHILTGGAGFIGSNLVKTLNTHSITDILVVDNLTNDAKFNNFTDCKIAGYLDKDLFLQKIQSKKFSMKRIESILHQGACTDTMEYDSRYMMANNYEYSKTLFHLALEHQIPIIYASSAAVYGTGTSFQERPENEAAINIYGFSKYLFDQYVRRHLPYSQSPVIGLRYFNVYGPHEGHKDRMASTIYQFYQQLKESGTVRLFEGTDGYEDGEQHRDFVYVDDVVAVNLFFLEQDHHRGIFNLGTGESRSFNDIANCLIDVHGEGQIQYIPFPETLRGKYQNFTEADISALRAAGYQDSFKTLEEAIRLYYGWLNEKQGNDD